MDTNVSALIAFLDQRQLGPVRSVLLVIIGWLVGNAVFSETVLRNQLKILEKCLDKVDNLSKYNAIKNELDAIYDHITEGIRIRSKYKWYEHSEKSTKFFLNLEKQRGAQNTIKKLIVDDKEIIDQTHILEYIREF